MKYKKLLILFKNKTSKKGFTLIEILIVLGIVAILAAGVIVAINPGRQFAQARNTQRWTDVNAVLNAVHQRMVDNKGNFANDTTCDALPTTAKTITSAAGAGNVNLCACLSPTYVGTMPFDPSASGASYTSCADYDTQYTVMYNASTSRITVSSPSAELGTVISISR